MVERHIFTASCPSCGTKRDPLEDCCPTCGDDYEYSAHMAKTEPSQGICRDCKVPISFITSAKSGTTIAVNPKRLQGVRRNGVVESFWIAHAATCHRKSRR